MRIFKVGDRVRYIGEAHRGRSGKEGVVVGVYNLERINIRFDIDGINGIIYRVEKDSIERVAIPQPQKSLLRSGDMVVYRGGSKRYVLVETGGLYVENGSLAKDLCYFTDDLLESRGAKSEDIMQVYRNGELIMERAEKSEREKEVEQIQAEMAKLSKRLDELK